MEPLSRIRYPIMMRVRRENMAKIVSLAVQQGLRAGPFCTHVMETIAQCPPERYHAAMAAFMDEVTKRR